MNVYLQTRLETQEMKGHAERNIDFAFLGNNSIFLAEVTALMALQQISFLDWIVPLFPNIYWNLFSFGFEETQPEFIWPVPDVIAEYWELIKYINFRGINTHIYLYKAHLLYYPQFYDMW